MKKVNTMKNQSDNRAKSQWSEVLTSLTEQDHNKILARMTETSLLGRGGGCQVDDESLAMGIDYITNSSGYRSPEFTENHADILALGCSQTYGMGVQNNEIWPELLSKMLGMSYANVGECGSSIYAIMGQAMTYVRDVGKPKVIVALLPGWDRMEIAVNPRYNLVNPRIVDVSDEHDVQQLSMSHNGNRNKNIPAYAKRPYVLDEILSSEVALSQSGKALSHLMDYCRALDVPLVFSTWHESMVELLDIKSTDPDTKWDLSGYVRFDPYPLMNEGASGVRCHLDAEGADSPSWNFGQDKGRHMGAHVHLHYAEAFRDVIISKFGV